MDVRKVIRLKVSQASVMAACLGTGRRGRHCANEMQSILVISMPSKKNTEASRKVRQIRVRETLHEVSAYVTPPGDMQRSGSG